DANGRYVGTQSLYVNGALAVSLANVSYLPNAARPLYVGAGANETTPNDSSRLTGLIDEVAVYNTALTTAQIQAHYQSGITTLFAPRVTTPPPAEGTNFSTGTTVNLTADASDSDGSVTKVEFFDGPAKIGEAANVPYTFAWNGAPDGVHAITARATDDST